MTRLGGFSESEKNAVLGVSVVTAAAAAVVTGRVLARSGPRAVLVAVLPTVCALTLLSAAVGEPWTVWLAAPVLGGALGCIWTADRVFMLRLTPHEIRGEFFGFFNLSSRVASAIGPLLIWSGTVWLLHQHTDWLSPARREPRRGGAARARRAGRMGRDPAALGSSTGTRRDDVRRQRASPE